MEIVLEAEGCRRTFHVAVEASRPGLLAVCEAVAFAYGRVDDECQAAHHGGVDRWAPWVDLEDERGGTLRVYDKAYEGLAWFRRMVVEARLLPPTAQPPAGRLPTVNDADTGEDGEGEDALEYAA